MTVTTEARNATLKDLANILRAQQDAKLDFVAPATTLRSKGGLLVAKDADVTMDFDGVTTRDGVFRPTRVFDEGVSDKLGIPLPYVRKLRETRPDLYDANVNGWLHGKTVQRLVDVASPDSDGVVRREFSADVIAPADSRSFLVRAFRGNDGEPGVARALLSDSYAPIDNLDVLTAALDGIRQAGVEVSIDKCDLTDRRMYVTASCPQISALAPTLMKGYRNPFADPAVQAARYGRTIEQWREIAAREGLAYSEEEGGEPIVFAGFVLSNSEVGDGAMSITPRLVVQVCKNGLTIAKDVQRSIHLGSKLEAGIIRWSEETNRKTLELAKAKARDSVATFLDADYVAKAVAKIEESAGAPVTDAAKTIELVGKKLAFSEAERTGILDHFIRGGQMTAGGVAQAVTSFCQTVPDADAAFDLEAKALAAMELVAAR